MLSPINFDALYAQKKETQAQQATEAGASESEPPASETVQ